MKEVLCWCCEYYELKDSESFGLAENLTFGVCNLKNIDRLARENVCEDFLKSSGLHTQRTIPDYCKNYKKINLYSTKAAGYYPERLLSKKSMIN